MCDNKAVIMPRDLTNEKYLASIMKRHIQMAYEIVVIEESANVLRLCGVTIDDCTWKRIGCTFSSCKPMQFLTPEEAIKAIKNIDTGITVLEVNRICRNRLGESIYEFDVPKLLRIMGSDELSRGEISTLRSISICIVTSFDRRIEKSWYIDGAETHEFINKLNQTVPMKDRSSEEILLPWFS